MLKHVQQQDSNDCVSACMAMILDKPLDVVKAEFHEPFCRLEVNVDDYLARHGVQFTKHYTIDPVNIGEIGIYLLTVSSLNIRGALHQIIVETTERGDWVIHDPNNGKEGKLYYGCDEGSVDLEYWCTDLVIRPEGLRDG